MAKSFREFIKSIFSYTVINVLEKIIPFVLIPVFARILDVESFGRYLLALAIVDIVMPIISVGSESFLLREYYDRSNLDYNKLVRQVLLVMFGLSFVLFIISNLFFILGLNEFLSVWSTSMIIVLALSRQINRVKLTIYRVKENIIGYGRFALLSSLFRNLLAYLLLIKFGGWAAIILGFMIVQLLFAIFSVISLGRQSIGVSCSQMNGFREIFRFGVPVVGHRLGAWLGNSGVRLVTSRIVSIEAVGLLGAAGFYQSILNVLQQSFNSAYVPFLYRMLHSGKAEDQRKMVVVTLCYYLVMFVVCFLFAVIALNYHHLVFGEGYVNAKGLVLPLIATAGLNGLYKMHVNILFYLKKTATIFRITLFAGTITLILVYLLGNIYGIRGIVWSILIGQLVAYLATTIISNIALPLQWLKILGLDEKFGKKIT